MNPPPIPTFLPQPFDWCYIPAGDVTIQHNQLNNSPLKRVYVPEFLIAKYPITYAQYQVFLDSQDGYVNPSWWSFSQSAQLWRTENLTSHHYVVPDDYPRTAITWYEAVAFSAWLSHRLDMTITLQSEAQWQRAAQGDDGRNYPWGNHFDANHCHFNAQGITSVMQYPTGASPYGVMDMCGNVSEWSITEAIHRNDDVTACDNLDDCTYMILGGAWNRLSPEQVSILGGKTHIYPDDAIYNCGFRLVCTYSKS